MRNMDERTVVKLPVYSSIAVWDSDIWHVPTLTVSRVDRGKPSSWSFYKEG